MVLEAVLVLLVVMEVEAVQASVVKKQQDYCIGFYINTITFALTSIKKERHFILLKKNC